MSTHSTQCNRVRSRRLSSFFRRDERGSVTVEFVLWFPFFIVILAVITDFVFIYMTNSSMWNAARTAARAMSVRMVDKDGAADMITDILIRGGTYEYRLTIDDASSDVSAAIRIDIGQASIFGILTPLVDEDLIAAVKMEKEPL